MKWIRRAATEPRLRTVAPLTFLRRAAYIPMGVACLSTSRQERIFSSFESENVGVRAVEKKNGRPGCTNPA
jgi:hypothetical protein